MTPTIDPEFRALIPRLSEDERIQLEANLLSDGCRDPLVVWGELLLDGHNRLDICTKHGLPYRVIPILLADRLAARIWIRWNQLGRRNLTDDQRAVISDKLAEELQDQSKHERASAGGKAGGVGRPKNSLEAPAASKLKKERQRREVSKRSKVSERKMKKARKVRRRAPELAAKVEAGEMTLAEAARQIKPAERAEKLAAAVWPDGQYGVILADPPWKPDEGVLDPTRRIENQYPTLTLDELLAMAPRIEARALPDCVLLLWAPTQKLADAVALIAGWGFTVKSGAVWVKDSVGMGYWFRSRHELLLLATRGNPMTPLEANRPDSVITAKRRRHSEKPDEVYALVERMFPQIPKVELFARASRPGWAVGTNKLELRSA